MVMFSQGYVPDNSITLAKLVANILANSAAGRAKMEDGFLSADAAGRAKMAAEFITGNKLEATFSKDLLRSGLIRYLYAANLGATGQIARTVNKCLIFYASVDAGLLNIENITVVQGTWGVAADASAGPHGQFYGQTVGPAQNDQISFGIICPKTGTYNFKLKHLRQSTEADFTILLDGVAQGSPISGYNATLVYNVVDTLSFSIAAGTHTISIKAASRNGSATNWYQQFTEILIEEA